MKLLYAEDEIAMSEAIVDILTYHKYIVDAVYDGEEALEYAQAGQYDGIVLDIMLPKLDGLSVLKKLRSGRKQKLKTRSRGWIWGRMTICQSRFRWSFCLPVSVPCSGAGKSLPQIY